MGILYALSQTFGIKVKKPNDESEVDIEEIDLEELKAIEDNIEEINLSDLIKVETSVTKSAQAVNKSINIESEEIQSIKSTKIANANNVTTQKKTINRRNVEDLDK